MTSLDVICLSPLLYRKERTAAAGMAPSWPCGPLGRVFLTLWSPDGSSLRPPLTLSGGSEDRAGRPNTCPGRPETEAQAAGIRRGGPGDPVWGSALPSAKWASATLDGCHCHGHSTRSPVCCRRHDLRAPDPAHAPHDRSPQQGSGPFAPARTDLLTRPHRRAPGGGRGDPPADADQERRSLRDPEEAPGPRARRGPEDPATSLLHQRALLQPQGEVPARPLPGALKPRPQGGGPKPGTAAGPSEGQAAPWFVSVRPAAALRAGPLLSASSRRQGLGGEMADKVAAK